MRIQKKARKWVLNLWTIALTVLSATGLNPFEAMESPPVQSRIVRDVNTWVEISPGLDSRCIKVTDGTDDAIWRPTLPGR